MTHKQTIIKVLFNKEVNLYHSLNWNSSSSSYSALAEVCYKYPLR